MVYYGDGYWLKLGENNWYLGVDIPTGQGPILTNKLKSRYAKDFCTYHLFITNYCANITGLVSWLVSNVFA